MVIFGILKKYIYIFFKGQALETYFKNEDFFKDEDDLRVLTLYCLKMLLP